VSFTPSARAWSDAGILRFEAVLPIPTFDKNERLAPNCIRRESRADGGRLYFKPNAGLWKLSPAAVQFRAQLAKLTEDVFPRRPWFVKGIPWTFNFKLYGPDDVDHHISGLIDDLCAVGLAAGDKGCKRMVAESEDEDNMMLRRIEFTAWQGLQ